MNNRVLKSRSKPNIGLALSYTCNTNTIVELQLDLVVVVTRPSCFVNNG